MSSKLIRYVFGVFFLFSSAVSFSSSFTAGLLFLLATLIAIPPSAAQLERKFNISMSGNVRFFVVLLLVIVASASIPPIDSTTTLNNSTDVIAAPLTSTNNITTIAIPASTETPEVATTPDNKGTLDIITSPTGAIVTVDGVSQGLSPVKGLSVDKGNHVVDLYLSGYNPKSLKVYITNSDTKTIDWTFTPYVSSPTEIEESEVKPTETPEVKPTETPEVKPTETPEVKPTETPEVKPTETPEVKPTETPEVKPTETPTPEKAKAQVTTSDSKPTTTSNTIKTDSTLLYASSESNVYHSAGCRYIKKIKPEHLITFKNVKEAKAAGYRACKVCGG
ncbi:MAG: PEGA domain-containing protein [Methanosarcina sp.]|nr:PEGA domain-containing protein [Methanosarcina sp.]